MLARADLWRNREAGESTLRGEKIPALCVSCKQQRQDGPAFGRGFVVKERLVA
jgi:hypothetical protein